jgi:hypothetical protein
MGRENIASRVGVGIPCPRFAGYTDKSPETCGSRKQKVKSGQILIPYLGDKIYTGNTREPSEFGILEFANREIVLNK